MSDICGDMFIKSIMEDSRKLAMICGGIGMCYSGNSVNDIHAKLHEAYILADCLKQTIQTLKEYL